jgi:hypothetical protein
MPSGNRGEFIPRNYKPTPRIAQAVADLANTSILSREGANRTLTAHMPRMDADSAQDFVNVYRSGRDYQWQPPMVSDPMRSSSSAMAPERAEVIGRALTFLRHSRQS